ncbi:MAG: hypothetical protein U0350_00775 [Caldilineaceae bacterium]
MIGKMFDDELLHAFMNNFYGYGNYQGNFWFIGMEEHCSGSFDEVQKRLNVWRDRGKRELDDLFDYHTELGLTEAFCNEKSKHNTWDKLIRILFTANTDKLPTPDNVRIYRQKDWGRQNGNECLLELFPLPSRSMKDWLYDKYSRLPSLVSRKQYSQAWSGPRIERLKKRLETYQPKVVVFYSLKYREKYWERIVGRPFTKTSEKLYVYRKAQTLFVVINHPSPPRRSLPDSYFDNAGQFIKSELSKR